MNVSWWLHGCVSHACCYSYFFSTNRTPLILNRSSGIQSRQQTYNWNIWRSFKLLTIWVATCSKLKIFKIEKYLIKFLWIGEWIGFYFFSLCTVTRWNLYSFVLFVMKRWPSSGHFEHSNKYRPACFFVVITCFRRFSYKIPRKLCWFRDFFDILLTTKKVVISYRIIAGIVAVRTFIWFFTCMDPLMSAIMARDFCGEITKRTFQIR